MEGNPIHALDNFYSSGVGMAAMIGGDFLADSMMSKGISDLRARKDARYMVRSQKERDLLQRENQGKPYRIRNTARKALSPFPFASNWVDTPEQSWQRRGNERTVRYGLKHGWFKGETRNQLHTARRIKDISRFGTGVFAASLGYDIANTAVKAIVAKGATRRDRQFSMSTPEGFMDSNMAYTTRQRALRAIQASGSMHKRALGNEASFLKPGDF